MEVTSFIRINEEYSYNKIPRASGGFGFVYDGIRLKDGKAVILKFVRDMIVPKENWIVQENGRVSSEVIILEKVKHVPGVVKMIQWFNHVRQENDDRGLPGDVKYIVIVFESEDGDVSTTTTDLYDYITQEGSLEEDMAKWIAEKLIIILTECFALGITHGDIKDENILLNVSKEMVKGREIIKKLILLDWGSAFWTGKKEHSNELGTDVCNSPQLHEGEKPNGKPDTVWSLGILIYNMVVGDIPFDVKKPQIEKERQLAALCLKTQITKTEPVYPPYLSDECKDIIECCLKKQVEDRISFSRLLDHPWFKKK